jgi:hypothetical protein
LRHSADQRWCRVERPLLSGFWRVTWWIRYSQLPKPNQRERPQRKAVVFSRTLHWPVGLTRYPNVVARNTSHTWDSESWQKTRIDHRLNYEQSLYDENVTLELSRSPISR